MTECTPYIAITADISFVRWGEKKKERGGKIRGTPNLKRVHAHIKIAPLNRAAKCDKALFTSLHY